MHRDDATPERNARRIAATAIVTIVVVWLLWWQWDAVRGLIGGGEGTPAGPSSVETRPDSPPATTSAAAAAWADRLGERPSWPGDLLAPSDCAAIDRDLSTLCAAIDARDGTRSPFGNEGACNGLRELAGRLAARPPEVESELGHLDKLLGNLFHVSRTLGRERTRSLVTALADDPVLIEPAAMTLHAWVSSRGACLDGRADPFPPAVRYDYAVWLFRTLGGQALLRRRAPDVEGLISFYALLQLEQARRARHDPQGFDVRPEIERTRALIDSSRWVFREEYLRTLDGLARP